MCIFGVGSAGSGATAYLKLAATPSARASLAREAAALLTMQSGTASARELFPRVSASGTADGWDYLLQSALPGVPGLRLLSEPLIRDRLMRDAAEVASRFHASGSSMAPPSADDLRAWIDRPLSLVAELLPPAERRRASDTLDRLVAELHETTAGRTLVLGPIHGDYWPSNILAEPDGGVSGVIDWDSFEPRNLLLHDVLHLVLYTRKVLRGSELGAELRRALQRDEWSPVERAVLSLGVQDDGLGPATALRPRLLLYWLRQVAMNVERQPAEARRWRWVRPNVAEVISCL